MNEQGKHIMAHPTWTGHIRLGLLNIPVKVYKASDNITTISFNQLNRNTMNRIAQPKIDSVTGEQVKTKDIVKGYEHSKGEYVIVDPQELAELHPTRSTTLDVLGFVDIQAIPGHLYEEPYYIGTDDISAKPYKLLHHALQRKGQAAICKFVFRQTERLVAITPTDKGLVLNTLRYDGQMRSTEDIVPNIENVEVTEQELAMADVLIEQMGQPVDLPDFHSEYNDKLIELVEAKVNNAEVVRPEADVIASYTPSGTDDLLDILRQSIERTSAKQRGSNG